MAYFYSTADHDARLMSSSGLDVYNFLLTHPPNFSLVDLFRLTLPQLLWSFCAKSMGYDTYQKQGVFHMDDLNYLFPMTVFPNSVVTDGQKRVQKLLLDLVCSFSRTGQPSYSAPDDGLTQIVPPLSLETGVSRYFKVSAEPQIENDDQLLKELTLWNSVH